jgi:hypothetical protein
MPSSPGPILLSKYSVVLLLLLRAAHFLSLSICFFLSFSFSFLASHINIVFSCCLVLVRPMVYREKIRFSLFFLYICVVEIDVLFRVQVLLASSDGRRRRRTYKNKKYMRIQTYKHTTLFFSSTHPPIYLSRTCIKTILTTSLILG